MKRTITVLTLAALTALLLCAGCAAGEQTPSAPESTQPTASESPSASLAPGESTPSVPTVQPVVCDGFGMLRWGDGWQELFGAALPSQGEAHLDSGFSGYPCGAYYSFEEKTGLRSGWYQFNEDAADDGIQIYQTLRRALIALYGEHGQTMTGGTAGETTSPAPTIEDVIAAGGGSCTEVWGGIPTSAGGHVMVSLQLLEDGEVQLAYSFFS